MHSHLAEVVAETRLEKGASRRFESLAAGFVFGFATGAASMAVP